jgi:hypothetical protein
MTVKYNPISDPRSIIKKNVSMDEITETLLYDSDWPRIPFDKCWSIKKMIYQQPEGKPLTRMKLVDRAIKAMTSTTDKKSFASMIQQLNKDDWKELLK